MQYSNVRDNAVNYESSNSLLVIGELIMERGDMLILISSEFGSDYGVKTVQETEG